MFCFQVVENLVKYVTKDLLEKQSEDIKFFLQFVAPKNHEVCTVFCNSSEQHLFLISIIILKICRDDLLSVS